MNKLKTYLLRSENQNLTDMQMSLIRGGASKQSQGHDTAKNCSCGCQGPSSTADNRNANIEGGLVSPGVDVCDSILKRWTVTW